jgi:hypothetical protein
MFRSSDLGEPNRKVFKSAVLGFHPPLFDFEALYLGRTLVAFRRPYN